MSRYRLLGDWQRVRDFSRKISRHVPFSERRGEGVPGGRGLRHPDRQGRHVPGGGRGGDPRQDYQACRLGIHQGTFEIGIHQGTFEMF